jgi:hypothetical protein
MGRSKSAGLASSVVVVLSSWAVAGAGQAAEPRSTAPASPSPRAVVPPALAVPAGHRLAFELRAEGVQVYACAAGQGGLAWVFQSPEATLTETDGRAAGRHFAGPTWEAPDGSRVVGAKAAAATPDPSAIPWLLLRASSNAGAGRMAEVAWVQRIETQGGLPPAGCDAGQVGAVARVPYRATYAFYVKAS